MARPAQHLQAPHMRSDIRFGIASETFDGADSLLQVPGRPIDPLLAGNQQDIAVEARGPAWSTPVATIMPR